MFRFLDLHGYINRLPMAFFRYISYNIKMAVLTITVIYVNCDSMKTPEEVVDLPKYKKLIEPLDSNLFRVSGIVQVEAGAYIYIIGVDVPYLDNIVYSGSFVDAIEAIGKSENSCYIKIMEHIINRQDGILFARAPELLDEDYVHVICGDRSYKSKMTNDIFDIPYGKLVIISRESEASTVGKIWMNDREYITDKDTYLIPIDRNMSEYRRGTYMSWPLSLMCSRYDDSITRLGLPLDTNPWISMFRQLRVLNEISYKRSHESNNE